MLSPKDQPPEFVWPFITTAKIHQELEAITALDLTSTDPREGMKSLQKISKAACGFAGHIAHVCVPDDDSDWIVSQRYPGFTHTHLDPSYQHKSGQEVCEITTGIYRTFIKPLDGFRIFQSTSRVRDGYEIAKSSLIFPDPDVAATILNYPDDPWDLRGLEARICKDNTKPQNPKKLKGYSVPPMLEVEPNGPPFSVDYWDEPKLTSPNMSAPDLVIYLQEALRLTCAVGRLALPPR